jgi:hypothetical protein
MPPVHQALAAVMADVTHVGKDGKNQSQGYNFRGIDGVLNAVGPAMRRHQITILPELAEMTSEVVQVGKNRTPMKAVTVQVRYYFVGPDGDHLVCLVPGEAMDSGDKAVSKAMSVALRTALIQTLALPTHEPDPDEQSYERSHPSDQGFKPRPVATKPALEVVADLPAFDPADQDSWPELLSANDAKKAVLANFGGDKDAAKALWIAEFDGMPEVLKDDLLAALEGVS